MRAVGGNGVGTDLVGRWCISGVCVCVCVCVCVHVCVCHSLVQIIFEEPAPAQFAFSTKPRTIWGSQAALQAQQMENQIHLISAKEDTMGNQIGLVSAKKVTVTVTFARDAFLRRERTLGIPGVPLWVIKLVGPQSFLHLHERSRELYEKVFEKRVSGPWIALVASLLSPSSFFA